MRINMPVKTLLCTAAAVQAFTLVSCKDSKNDDQALPESFSVQAEITDGDFTALADMSRTPEGWEITMRSPDTVKGMKVSITSSDVRVECDKLSYSGKHDELPNTSPLRLTAAALDKCVKNKTSGQVFGERYKVSFKNGSPDTLNVGTASANFTKFKK